MKFITESDVKKCVHILAKEIFNFETGLEYYSNGVLNTDKLNKYPIVKINGINTSIKTNLIILVLPPGFDNYDVFGKLLFKYVDELYETHNVKSDFHVLETGSDHFCCIKAKPAYDFPNAQAVTTFKNHVSLHRNVIQADNLPKAIGARITIAVFNTDRYLYLLTKNKLSVETQLVTIFYDPLNITRFNNNDTYFNNFVLTDIRFLAGLLNVNCHGLITRDKIYEYKANNITYSETVQDMIKNMQHPEYLPGWETNVFTINLCKIRRAAFEIIRYYGKYNIYESSIIMELLPIEPITQNIYAVNFHDIVMLNDGDTCFKCKTLLYGETYAVFEDKTDNICYAYCPVCMHSKFNAETGLHDVNGEYLYTVTNVIGRFTYPRTVQDVIRGMKFEPLYLQILLDTQDMVNMVENETEHCWYLKNNLVGWSGNIQKFIDFVASNGNEIKYHNLKIFKFRYIGA